jgi:hypothetical protein
MRASFDSGFLQKQGIFILSPVQTSSKTDPLDATTDGEAPGVGDCSMGQGDAVNDCQLDIFRPILGKRNSLKCAQPAHRLSSNSLSRKEAGGYHKYCRLRDLASPEDIHEVRWTSTGSPCHYCSDMTSGRGTAPCLAVIQSVRACFCRAQTAMSRSTTSPPFAVKLIWLIPWRASKAGTGYSSQTPF